MGLWLDVWGWGWYSHPSKRKVGPQGRNQTSSAKGQLRPSWSFQGTSETLLELQEERVAFCKLKPDPCALFPPEAWHLRRQREWKTNRSDEGIWSLKTFSFIPSGNRRQLWEANPINPLRLCACTHVHVYACMRKHAHGCAQRLELSQQVPHWGLGGCRGENPSQ